MSNLNDYVVITTDNSVDIIGPDFEPEDFAGFCGNVRVYMTKETANYLAEDIQLHVLKVIAGYADVVIVDKIRLTTKGHLLV